MKLTCTGRVSPTAPPRHLHALIAGVNDYVWTDMALAYADKDALDFVEALEGQKGGDYADVDTRTIVDRDLTRASLIDGLDWLAEQAGPDDLSALFLAGHGVTEENLAYWYLPSDATEEQAHGGGAVAGRRATGAAQRSGTGDLASGHLPRRRRGDALGGRRQQAGQHRQVGRERRHRRNAGGKLRRSGGAGACTPRQRQTSTAQSERKASQGWARWYDAIGNCEPASGACLHYGGKQ